MGRLEGGLLKAAAKLNALTIVYCIGNVVLEYSVTEVSQQCLDKGIHVLSCLDITAENRSSRSYKVSISKVDIDNFVNPQAWPSRVFLRPWNYKSSGAAEGTQSDGHNDHKSSLSSSVALQSSELSRTVMGSSSAEVLATGARSLSVDKDVEVFASTVSEISKNLREASNATGRNHIDSDTITDVTAVLTSITVM